MTPCSTAILAEKSILQILHLKHRVFPKRFCKKVLRNLEVEIWKFTKNKLLKLVNSTKADFLLAGLNQNITIQKNR